MMAGQIRVIAAQIRPCSSSKVTGLSLIRHSGIWRDTDEGMIPVSHTRVTSVQVGDLPGPQTPNGPRSSACWRALAPVSTPRWTAEQDLTFEPPVQGLSRR